MNAVPLPTVNAGSDCGAQHRAGGSGRTTSLKVIDADAAGRLGSRGGDCELAPVLVHRANDATLVEQGNMRGEAIERREHEALTLRTLAEFAWRPLWQWPQRPA